MTLNWPQENALAPDLPANRWYHAGSNYCLDFHGDPSRSELCVFSDGNHHMALEQSLDDFRSDNNLESVFYCTTPPKVYLDWMTSGCIELGNLRLSRQPDIIIGPDDILASLNDAGKVTEFKVFAESTGNSLLIPKGNPRNISGVEDLYRSEIRLFLSNPETEKASHVIYRNTIEALSRQEGLSNTAIAELFQNPEKICSGELIHHREAPQAIVDGHADVALVYSHLALRYTRIFPDLFDRIVLPSGKDNFTTRYAVGIVEKNNALSTALFNYFSHGNVAETYKFHGLNPLAT